MFLVVGLIFVIHISAHHPIKLLLVGIFSYDQTNKINQTFIIPQKYDNFIDQFSTK